jgi:hypothetical protein
MLILTLTLLFFFLLVSNVVAPPLVAIEGVHWGRDGPKFVCRVDGCNAFYIAKYNLVQHLQGAPQYDHGARQVKTSIYLGGGPKASRSPSHECASLEQPFSLIPLKWAEGNC